MATENLYDVVILGVGPAGLQAAVHAGRRKASVLLLGQVQKSSLFTAHIDNYFSLFNMSGEEMLARGVSQAQRFGAEIWEENVLSIVADGSGFLVATETGKQLGARSIVLATGSKRRTLGVEGEKALLGKGVSYCVDCDGHFFRGQKVCIAGEESAAVDGALTLAQIAAEVHLIAERLQVSAHLTEALEASPVVIHKAVKITAIEGDDAVTGVRLSDGSRLALEGVFIELGAKGIIELALNLGVQLDETFNYLQVDKQQATNVPGIFAAGDICGRPWQLAKAVGEGCVAGISAAVYAKKPQAA